MFPIAACPPGEWKDSDKEKFNRFLLLQHFTYGLLFGKWPTGPNRSHFKCNSNGQRLRKKGSTIHKNLIITNHILPDLVPSDNNPYLRLKNTTNKRFTFCPREAKWCGFIATSNSIVTNLLLFQHKVMTAKIKTNTQIAHIYCVMSEYISVEFDAVWLGKRGDTSAFDTFADL